ncbi:hypothetical protein IPL68_06165 [Candidatus Saccharibacteria bacterium]|nr:MAG: hypothetical protein IPL68_06165 [Candidatus Saccharibacteria bacterium]
MTIWRRIKTNVPNLAAKVHQWFAMQFVGRHAVSHRFHCFRSGAFTVARTWTSHAFTSPSNWLMKSSTIIRSYR